MKNIPKAKNCGKMFQLGMNPIIESTMGMGLDKYPDWLSTIFDIDIDPEYKITGTNERPIAASYEIIWAEALTPPSNGYFDPEDHPAKTTL